MYYFSVNPIANWGSAKQTNNFSKESWYCHKHTKEQPNHWHGPAKTSWREIATTCRWYNVMFFFCFFCCFNQLKKEEEWMNHATSVCKARISQTIYLQRRPPGIFQFSTCQELPGQKSDPPQLSMCASIHRKLCPTYFACFRWNYFTRHWH